MDKGTLGSANNSCSEASRHPDIREDPARRSVFPGRSSALSGWRACPGGRTEWSSSRTWRYCRIPLDRHILSKEKAEKASGWGDTSSRLPDGWVDKEE